MVVFQSLKGSEKYVSISVFVVFACFLFLFSSYPVQKIGAPWLRKTQYGFEEQDLAEVLKNASMPNKTVILTTMNEAYVTSGAGSMLDLFLESFHLGVGTVSLLNHLVIVAMDPKAYDRCNAIHKHCFFLQTPGVNFTSEKRFMSKDYLKLMWKRIDFLRTVLELGYNFAFTDADIMWFRDPFPYLDASDDIQIACDHYNGRPNDVANRANGGFIFVRSNDTTIKFYKYWYMARLLHPGQHDQGVFEIIRNDPIVAATGVSIKYLDTLYFGGFCEPSKDMNKVCTMHANCCVGIDRKIYDLNLLLSDWKNFTAFPRQHKERGGNPWTAPHKCKEGWI